MSKPKNDLVGVRFSNAELEQLDAFAEKLTNKSPGVNYNRQTTIKAAIAMAIAMADRQVQTGPEIEIELLTERHVVHAMREARAQAACVEALEAMGEKTAARRLARHLAGVSTDLSVEVVAPFESLVGGKQST